MGTLTKSQISNIDVPERIEISLIRLPHFSMRQHYGDIDELASSIREVGLLQPLLVRPVRDGLELICGHRRLIACKMLRCSSVPCLIREVDEKEAFEIALAENIQRKSIDQIEEAIAFKKYIGQIGWGGVKSLATRVGKSPEYVSHRIALLRLPKNVLEDVKSGKISASTGYELLGMCDSSEEEQSEIAYQISNSKLSSREVRKLVQTKKTVATAAASNSAITSQPEPEFTCRPIQEERAEFKAIQSAILIHRVSLIRLDKLIDNCKEKGIRDFLFSHRIGVHNFIDDCVRYQKGLRSSPKRQV